MLVEILGPRDKKEKKATIIYSLLENSYSNKPTNQLNTRVCCASGDLLMTQKKKKAHHFW